MSYSDNEEEEILNIYDSGMGDYDFSERLSSFICNYGGGVEVTINTDYPVTGCILYGITHSF